MEKPRVGIVLLHTQAEHGISSLEAYAGHDGYEHRYASLIRDYGGDALVYVLSYEKRVTEIRHRYGHTIVALPVSFSLRPGLQWSFPLLKRVREDFRTGRITLLHVMGYYPFLYDLIALLAFHERIPLVVQMHSGRTLSRIVRFLPLLFTLRLAQQILYVDPAEESFHRLLHVQSTLFPNWVEKEFVDLGKKRQRDRFLFVGSVANKERIHMKGFDILVDFFSSYVKKNPHASLTIVGSVESSWADYVRCIPNTVLEGVVDRTTLISLYNDAYLTIIPSRFEPFSLVAAESLACGTPVIMSSQCGIAKILRTYPLLMEKPSVSAIESLVERVHTTSYDVLREQSKEHVSLFQRDVAAQKLFDLYARAQASLSSSSSHRAH